MKLVFLYGPPAVGKLTVAKELAARTGYRLFHNHLTVDLAVSLFDFDTEPYLRFIRKLRLDILGMAADEGLTGVVATFAYSHPLSEPFIERLRRLADEKHIEILWVRLTCDWPTLEARVASEDRKRFRKVSSVERLRELVKPEVYQVSIPGVESLVIDNTDRVPSEVAEQIARHHDLATVPPPGTMAP